jgi:hypothetical protein
MDCSVSEKLTKGVSVPGKAKPHTYAGLGLILNHPTLL